MNAQLKKFINKTFDKPGKALDLGAGNFVDVESLKKIGWHCEGVDKKNGVDLEKPYLSKYKLFNLVFSNYVVHKISNKKKFFRTVFNNLKPGGWLFIHTFDKSDQISLSTITARSLENYLQKTGFEDVSTHTFKFYDNEDGHKHWHNILEITARKVK